MKTEATENPSGSDRLEPLVRCRHLDCVCHYRTTVTEDRRIVYPLGDNPVLQWCKTCGAYRECHLGVKGRHWEYPSNVKRDPEWIVLQLYQRALSR